MNHVIKFVGLFETLEPGLCKILRAVIDDDGKDMAYRIADALFEQGDGSTLNVLHDFHWLHPYCRLYIKNYKVARR